MIYLIRHGEASAAWGSHPDPGLSEKGRKQAKFASEALSRLGADSVMSSPMARCRETAAPFAGLLGLEPGIDRRVAEIITPAGVDDRVKWLSSLMSGTWEDAGPVLCTWRDEVVSTLEAVPDGTAVFSHFVAINAAVSKFMGRDEVVVFRPGHCSITQLVRAKGKLKVIKIGEEANVEIL